LLTNSPFWFFFFWKMSHSIPSIQEVNFMLSLFYVNWVTNGRSYLPSLWKKGYGWSLTMMCIFI
jgi:hypothetical protein